MDDGANLGQVGPRDSLWGPSWTMHGVAHSKQYTLQDRYMHESSYTQHRIMRAAILSVMLCM